MGMSQEEIEALMNESADLTPAVEEVPIEEDIEEETSMSQEDIADLVADVDTSNEVDESIESDNLDDILAGIDGITEDESVEEPSDNVDDILAGIEGITNDEPEEPAPVDNDISAIMNEQINQGVYPLPVEKEHKVVNQLNEVAEDSEEKASQIFDVLSFILDENNEIQTKTKAMDEFVQKQTALLEALVLKFPNVEVFSQNLEQAKSISSESSQISEKINEENNQIFVAMDLMQYHDINRQKIERVMSVIRKLSTYLNGIFEDESGKPEVQIAQHISGDSAETVTEDDIDSLIAEFNN